MTNTMFKIREDEYGSPTKVDFGLDLAKVDEYEFYLPGCEFEDCSVELLDLMGSDLSVVNAARVSFHKKSSEIDLRDEKLIKYLASHNHWTPFSQVQFQFRIKMPFFVARQYFKHTVGLTRNEVSRRYVKEDPTFWLPTAGLRKSADNVKQGSSEELVENNDLLLDQIAKHSYDSLVFYKKLLAKGVCPEQARIVLPQNTFTEFIETGSLAAYARIYGLRAEKTAQKEIQDFAIALGTLIQPNVPLSWKALTSHD